MNTKKYLESIKKSKKILSQVKDFVAQQKILDRAVRQIDHKIDDLLEQNMDMEVRRNEFDNR